MASAKLGWHLCLVECFPQHQQASVPDEDVPRGLFVLDVFPGQNSGQQQRDNSEHRREGNVDPVESGGEPESANTGEDCGQNPLVPG